MLLTKEKRVGIIANYEPEKLVNFRCHDASWINKFISNTMSDPVDPLFEKSKPDKCSFK